MIKEVWLFFLETQHHQYKIKTIKSKNRTCKLLKKKIPFPWQQKHIIKGQYTSEELDGTLAVFLLCY